MIVGRSFMMYICRSCSCPPLGWVVLDRGDPDTQEALCRPNGSAAGSFFHAKVIDTEEEARGAETELYVTMIPLTGFFFQELFACNTDKVFSQSTHIGPCSHRFCISFVNVIQQYSWISTRIVYDCCYYDVYLQVLFLSVMGMHEQY